MMNSNHGRRAERRKKGKRRTKVERLEQRGAKRTSQEEDAASGE